MSTEPAAAQYEEREAKLAVKANALREQGLSLDTQRQEFRRVASEWRLKEKWWCEEVMPELLRYESHKRLDARALELQASVEALEAAQIQLTIQQQELERLGISWDSLKEKSADLEKRESELSKQAESFAGLRQELQRTEQRLRVMYERIRVKLASLRNARRRIASLDRDREALREEKLKFEQRVQRQHALHDQRLSERRQWRSELESERAAVDARRAEYERATVLLRSLTKGKQDLEDRTADLKEQLSRARAELAACLERKQAPVQPRTKNRALKDRDDDAEPPPLPRIFRGNSPMTKMGYHVGVSGIGDDDERHNLLDRIVETALDRLPVVGPAGYMSAWGDGKTRARVRAIALHLRWNIDFPGSRPDSDLARRHWLSDLRWLRANYSLPASWWPETPRF